MIAAVLFDLDETLLDRTASLTAFLIDQFERHATVLGDTTPERWQQRFLELDRRGRVPKSEVYPRLLAELGADPALASGLLREYRETSCRFALPFPGMADTLRALRLRGLKLGIVTNGETEIQSRNIAALGLEALVDTILISESERLRKPDPALFHRAAAKLAVAPADCLFVGDSPEADILGARAVGMQTAWFTTGLPWPEGLAPADHLIRSLPDVVAIADGDDGVIEG